MWNNTVKTNKAIKFQTVKIKSDFDASYSMFISQEIHNNTCSINQNFYLN